MGLEKRSDAQGCCLTLTCDAAGTHLRGLGSRERDVEHAMFEGTLDHKPAGVKDLQHAVVFSQHICLERLDALLPGDACQMLEQQRGNAAPLMGLGHFKRHFGTRDWLAMLRDADIAPNADKGLLTVLTKRRHERHMAHEVKCREGL